MNNRLAPLARAESVYAIIRVIPVLGGLNVVEAINVCGIQSNEFRPNDWCQTCEGLIARLVPNERGNLELI